MIIGEYSPRRSRGEYSPIITEPEAREPEARDLAIPVRRSNQLSYEATDIGSWSFVGSNVPVRNESTMKWYMKWIIYELRIWFKPRWSPEIFRLLYAIAKIAFITARIIASLNFWTLFSFKNFTVSSWYLWKFVLVPGYPSIKANYILSSETGLLSWRPTEYKTEQPKQRTLRMRVNWSTSTIRREWNCMYSKCTYILSSGVNKCGCKSRGCALQLVVM